MERAAQETLRGTGFARDFAISSLVNDVVQIYWRCLASDQIAATTKEADRRATDYEDSLHQMAGRGMIEPTVAQRASAIAVSRRLSVEQSEEAAASCHRDLAAATAGFTRQGPASRPLATCRSAWTGWVLALDRLNETALQDLALENRADAKAARQSVAAAQAKVEGARDATSPTLNLNIEPDRAIVRYSQSIENNTGEGLVAEANADQSTGQHQPGPAGSCRSAAQVLSGTPCANLRRAYADWTIMIDAGRQADGCGG